MAEFDPSLVKISYASIPLVTFADGTFVRAERTEDAFAMDVGAGGAVTRRRIRNRTGMVSVTLMAEAPENDLLSALAAADELTGLGKGVVSVTDVFGTSAALAEEAWIRKVPAIEWMNGAAVREWIFDCADLELFVGSSLL